LTFDGNAELVQGGDVAPHGSPIDAQAIGDFGPEDTFKGRPILVRFSWSGASTRTPRWEQAFSDDGGDTWETNWVMEFTPAGGRG